MKIVAEVGLQHCGCLGTALAYVDSCAKAGVGAVKFQCHDFDPVDKFRPGFESLQDVSRQDYWRRTAFTIEQWQMIRASCHANGVQFGLSVFSPAAVRWLHEHDCEPDFWKLGSGVSTDPEMILAIRLSGQSNAVLSFGMSSVDEIKKAYAAAAFGNSESAGLKLTLLQCTSEYPCPPEHIGIKFIWRLYRIGYEANPVGISDHSGTIWPSIVAAWMGADMCEVHVTWSKECFGPDVPASITIDELRQLVQGVRFVEKMRANPVDKDEMASKLSEMREVFCVPH